MQDGVLPALILSTLAGMSTAVGSLIALFSKRSNTKFLTYSIGFSAGVMVLVSFWELLPDSRQNLIPYFGDRGGGLAAAAALIGGMLLAAFIDKLVPSGENKKTSKAANKNISAPLVRTGIFMALTITLHNFPEGIATFMAGLTDIKLGLPIAFSIALHNIPEGIAVSAPIYYGTGSKLKAFSFSALSGLSEPLGALAAYFILAPFINNLTMGIIFAVIAGIMIYISFDELIPTSERYGHNGWSLLGIITGMLVMWTALELFNYI